MDERNVTERPVLWTSHSLSVLVPAFNERDNLAPTVERLFRALNVSVEDFDIIIVDDGSSDGTAEVADQLAAQYPQVRVFHNPRNVGLGYCYLRGIEVARGSSFVYIPGDNTWPHRSFLELFGNLGKADVVTSYSTNPKVRPLGRRIISSLYTRTLNLLFGLRLRYYNGLAIYPLAFLRSNPIGTHGFGFQAEALLRAIYQGLSFVEVAIPIDERTAGRSKAVTVKNILSVLSTIRRVFWQLRLSPRRGPRSLAPEPRDSSGMGRADTQLPQAELEKHPTPIVRRTAAPLRIIITGASSGIGAALVAALAGDGHTPFVCARRSHLLDQVTRNNRIADARSCDVSDEEQVKVFVAWVKTMTPYVDAVVNCAGGFGAIGPLETTDSDEWLDTLRVNLFGTYLMIKHSLPLLAGSSDPRILNFSGGGAFSAFRNYSAYACSKAAIVRLTECLAAELAAKGVAVNGIAPGFVATEAHQATLAAGPERAGPLHYRRTKTILEDGGVQMANVIECVRTLLSPETRGLTGKTISANFDPWRTEVFKRRIQDITRSDLWTMRRLNIVNLPEGSLRTALAEAWASHGTQPERVARS